MLLEITTALLLTETENEVRRSAPDPSEGSTPSGWDSVCRDHNPSLFPVSARHTLAQDPTKHLRAPRHSRVLVHQKRSRHSNYKENYIAFLQET